MRKLYIAVAAAAVISCMTAAQCLARRIEAGDDLPSFSVAALSGRHYDAAAGAGRATLVAFLTAAQKPSQQAAQDLQRVVTSVKEHELDIVIVMDDPALADAFKDTDPNDAIYLIHDTEKQLWGQFHIIAAPTVVIADKSGKIISVVAGYGYDFQPALRFHLNQALGIAQTMTAEDVGTVKTAQNNTASARMQRHLKMAQMLQEKGKTDAALQQLEMARQADPNDLQVALQVGTLYCTSNQPQKALDAVENLKPSLRKDSAQVQLITGWAKRLLGDFPAAQEYLLKAAEADPGSARAFFELGQVYEVTSQQDLALKAYKKALSILMKDK